MQDFTKSIDIPPRGDEYDGIRKEYGDMLKNQLQKGNNGLTKRKYITFGIEADDLRTAKMRLERIETDVLANFKTLGVQARSLNGLERLELLHSQLHPDGQEKFHFQWSDLPKTGLSTKDFVSPSGLSFSKDGKTFRVGDHSGAVSFLQILAPELTDRLLADLLDLNDAVTVNLHMSRTFWLPVRSKIFLRTRTLSICSTRPRETVRFWQSSWGSPRTNFRM